MTVTAGVIDDRGGQGFMAVPAVAMAGAPPRPPVAQLVPIGSPG